MGLWSALDGGVITGAQACAWVIPVLTRSIARWERWLTHYENRLSYERAMLADSGGTATDKTGPEKGGACKCWASHRGGWSYIQKVNTVSVTVFDNWGNGGRNFTRTIPFDKLSAVMTKNEVDAARAEGTLRDYDDGTGFALLEAPPTPEMREVEVNPAPADTPDFEAMKQSLKAGVQVVSANQLFPTPPEVAARMVQLAQIEDGQEVLEPSAGTGALIDAVRVAMSKGSAGRCAMVAVEINQTLAHRLAFNDCLGGDRVHPKDFLDCNGDLGTFDRILMNPPFENGSDIKHIQHAVKFLKPGGRLVAICANGPRQNATLKPMVWDSDGDWEELPEGTFTGTGVRTVMLTINAPREEKKDAFTLTA